MGVGVKIHQKKNKWNCNSKNSKSHKNKCPGQKKNITSTCYVPSNTCLLFGSQCSSVILVPKARV